MYADRLRAALSRNIAQPFRFVLVTDNPDAQADIVSPIVDADQECLQKRGCLARMRMFAPEWQQSIGAARGDRIVNIDVDAVVIGNLDALFNRTDEFTIMQGFNQTNRCPFNGSLWMFQSGERRDVYEDFSFEAYAERKVPFHAFPDDQGWLHHKFPKAKAYTPRDGVYAFKKIGWGEAGRRGLPSNARLVAFPGRDPGDYPELDWIKRNWLC